TLAIKRFLLPCDGGAYERRRRAPWDEAEATKGEGVVAEEPRVVHIFEGSIEGGGRARTQEGAESRSEEEKGTGGGTTDLSAVETGAIFHAPFADSQSHLGQGLTGGEGRPVSVVEADVEGLDERLKGGRAPWVRISIVHVVNLTDVHGSFFFWAERSVEQSVVAAAKVVPNMTESYVVAKRMATSKEAATASRVFAIHAHEGISLARHVPKEALCRRVRRRLEQRRAVAENEKTEADHER
ncbi:MAG: hypothetical protein BJ554DRAFT_6328, partial [Olpidium bornovanus]